MPDPPADPVTIAKILATASVGVAVAVPVTDPSGAVVDFRFTYLNQAGAALFGRSPEDVVGWRLLEMPEAYRLAWLLEQYVRAYEDGEPFHDLFEYHDDHVGGFFDVNARRVDDLIVVTFADVTERVEARRREQMSWQRMVAAFERIPDAVFALDRAWRFTYLNAQAERILGRQGDELIGRVVWEEYPAIAEYLPFVASVLELGEPATFESAYFPAPLDRQFVVRLFPDAGGVTVYFTELEPLRRLEERAAYLERLEAIATLAGGVAHDFNNLLMVISGHASLLATEVDPASPAGEGVAAIAEAAARAAELTAELLTFSRQQVLQPSTVDLNDLVRRRVGEWQAAAGSAITVEFLVAGEPVLVRVDAGEILRALDHIVENAVDAMPEGGRLVIETSRAAGTGGLVLPSPAASSGEFGVVTVADDGIGMDATTLARSVEPFFTTKSRSDSSGLGLSVADGAARQAGGRLAIYSEPGVGTTVRVYLPTRDDGAEVAEDTGVLLPDAGGSETVLVVDDNRSVRALTARILADRGYEVLIAPDADGAMAIVRERGSDIALMVVDVVMPGRTGPELALDVRDTVGPIPVLYVSGYPENSVIAQGVPADGVHFLPKPFAPAELASRVRTILDRHA